MENSPEQESRSDDNSTRTMTESQEKTSALGIPADSALFDVRSHVLIWPLAVLMLGLDLWSKSYIFHHLGLGDTPSHLGGLITFRRSLNPGALFGMGKGMAPLFIAASMLALLFVLYLFACSSKRHRMLHIGLAMILAGALGNLYDRSQMIADVVEYHAAPGDMEILSSVVEIIPDQGAEMIPLKPWGLDEYTQFIPLEQVISIKTRGVVRDFIKIEPIGGVDIWPWVFNIADIFLSVGVAVLLIQFWQDRRLLKAEAEKSKDATA